MTAAATTEEPSRPQRERKKVEVLNISKDESKKKGPNRVEGEGTKLRDIEFVKAMLDKVKADDDVLKILHRALFGTEGQRLKRKTEILSFSGLKGATGDDTKEIVDASTRILGTFTQAGLNQVLSIFALPHGSGDSGTKDARVARLIEYLCKPEDNGKKAPAKGKKSSTKAKPKKVSDEAEGDAGNDEGAEEEAPKPKAMKSETSAKAKVKGEGKLAGQGAKRKREKADANSSGKKPKSKGDNVDKKSSKKSTKAKESDAVEDQEQVDTVNVAAATDEGVEQE